MIQRRKARLKIARYAAPAKRSEQGQVPGTLKPTTKSRFLAGRLKSFNEKRLTVSLFNSQEFSQRLTANG